MLGSHTKQINAYGKRGKRIIDDRGETNQTLGKVEIISIFDDLPPPPEWKSVASRMKKRENVAPPKSSTISTKVVGLQKKRRLSPVLSPVKRKPTSRVGQLIESEAVRKPKAVLKSKQKSLATGNAADPIILSTSPTRAPLLSVALNIPGTPISRNVQHSMKHRAIKANRHFSPFVDVDIIVLDDNGRTVRAEKRVFRTDADANPFHQTAEHAKSYRHTVPPTQSDTESSEIVSQLRPIRRKPTQKTVILSDDSDSDIANSSSTNLAIDHVKEIESPSGLAIPSTFHTTRPNVQSKVEVLIPRLPYKVATRILPPLSKAPELTPQVTSQLLSPKVRRAAPQPIIPASNAGAFLMKPRYQHSDSPMQKARQLTPIRGDRRRLFNPPFPTTPTDFDISANFSDLSLGSESFAQETYQSDFDIPDYLIPLLEECHQETCGPHNFSTFIESFRYDPILQSARRNDLIDMEFKKIGEASYSEVFGIGDVVLKVIPLRDESSNSQNSEDADGPAPSDAKDVRKEIIVTRAMGEVHAGFVKLLKTYVVKGKYPEVLLKLWDDFNERKGSESMRPDNFKGSQIYAIIVLPNGGPDLEAYTFCNASKTGWRQACSLFWQVVKTLAHAEHLVSFEHRDLHWGQVLVKNIPTNALKSLNLNHKTRPKSNRLYMDDLGHGVQATVIDLGLSRMDAGDGDKGVEVHWTPFDDEVFMGEGDYQFEVYRMMKHLTSDQWEDFHPITNILWLHYLLQKMIYHKGIKPPAAPRKPKVTPETPLPPPADTAFSEKDCYDCLIDLENWLGNSITEMVPASSRTAVKGKAKRKAQSSTKVASFGLTRSGEIVAYGVKKGWIKATSLT